jgi:hypothetical protein
MIATLLAHGGAALRLFAGWLVGFPLALLAVVATATACGRMRRIAVDNYIASPHLLDIALSRWEKRRRAVRMAGLLSWISLIWNAGTCAFILQRGEMPSQWDSLLTDEYILFFGPSILLSTLSVLAASIMRYTLSKRGVPQHVPTKCAKCGYLLTGLVVARCPGCGTPFDLALLKTEGESVHR